MKSQHTLHTLQAIHIEVINTFLMSQATCLKHKEKFFITPHVMSFKHTNTTTTNKQQIKVYINSHCFSDPQAHPQAQRIVPYRTGWTSSQGPMILVCNLLHPTATVTPTPQCQN